MLVVPLKTAFGTMVATVAGRTMLFWSMVAVTSTLKEMHEFATTLPVVCLAVVRVFNATFFVGLIQFVLLALSPVTFMTALNMMPFVLSGPLTELPEKSEHELNQQVIAIEVLKDNNVDVLSFTLN